MNKLTIKCILSCLFAMFLLFIPLRSWSAVPQYVDTPNKDFNAEAPWRVETVDTPIPFSVLIKDVWKNDLKALRLIEIVTLAYPGPKEIEKVYSLQLNDVEIRCSGPENPVSNTEGCINGNWELNIYTFRGTADPALDGQLITPARLGYQTGDDIYFRVLIQGEDEFWIPSEFKKYLKVHVGVPLPKPAANWFYGDTHFHTEYTNDPKEFGGQLTAVRDAANAMGLDFITTTDHASDLADVGWQGWFGCWDLCQASWDDLKKRINELNDGNGLLFIWGEEITCQAVDGDGAKGGIHLLVYNNDSFISGKINAANIPEFSLENRLKELDSTALAYAAHPMDSLDIVVLHQIAEWSTQNYNTALADPLFKGLEIWNTRKTKRYCLIEEIPENLCPKLNLDFYVNPFDEDGQWPIDVANWDEKLVAGIEKWDELLRVDLDPLRKIFISGGSDAHGDLNYTIGGVGPLIALNDNAMGKVKTLVYASGGKNRENILNGLRNGRSVVTDGPVVIFGIDRDQNGRLEGNGSDVIIGDHIVLPQGDATTFFIQWISTDEFGDIDEIVIFRGDTHQTQPVERYQLNGKEGSLTWSQNATMAPGTYYYRVEARVKDEHGNIAYRCYTNPIWVTYRCLATVSQYNWKGEYFTNKDLSGTPLMVRDDGEGFLNFDWANGSPGSACGLGTDNFSARWTRSVHFEGGTYRFTVTSDDGVRLYVDGKEVLSEWKIQGPTTYDVDVALSAGYHWVIMEYYENGGYAIAKLSWNKTVQSLPDLKVSSITFSTPPKAGVLTTAFAWLSNAGGSASGGFNVKWFLDGVQVGYGSHSSLAPGQVSTGNVRFGWTPTPGVHTLRFEADVDNHVRESNENNNKYQKRINVSDYADLKVSGITFTSPPRAGVPTTAVARLSNAGGSDSGVFNIKWFLDGVQVGYGSHSSLAPGQVSTGNVRFGWTPTPGNHTLRFEADVDNHVTESKENNNSYEVAISVSGGLADLKVSSITFSTPPEVGVLTTAFAWLSNVGQVASGTFSVKWFLDGVQVGYGYHTPLAPGQVSIDNVRFDWMPTRGVHTLRFEADVDKEVAESNENNNKYQKRVTVTE